MQEHNNTEKDQTPDTGDTQSQHITPPASHDATTLPPDDLAEELEITVESPAEAPIPASAAKSTGPQVFLADSAIAQMNRHAAEEPDHEVGGIMVGTFNDGERPLVLVEDIIRGEKMDHRRGSVTFTHETWDDINRIKDEQFADKQIVGWYHSHPGFGVFLSGHDLFIQQNFFNQPWHVAYVTDPRAGQHGCFVWRQGEIVLDQEYQVYTPGTSYEALPASEAPEQTPSEGQQAVSVPSLSLTQPHDSSRAATQRGITWALGILAALIGVLCGIALYSAHNVIRIHNEMAVIAEHAAVVDQRLQIMADKLDQTPTLDHVNATDGVNGQTAIADSDFEEYTVGPEDTWKSVIEKFYPGIADHLRRLNMLEADELSPGMTIKVPKKTEHTTESPIQSE